jgi:hypothetical protein
MKTDTTKSRPANPITTIAVRRRGLACAAGSLGNGGSAAASGEEESAGVTGNCWTLETFVMLASPHGPAYAFEVAWCRAGLKFMIFRCDGSAWSDVLLIRGY